MQSVSGKKRAIGRIYINATEIRDIPLFRVCRHHEGIVLSTCLQFLNSM